MRPQGRRSGAARSKWAVPPIKYCCVTRAGRHRPVHPFRKGPENWRLAPDTRQIHTVAVARDGSGLPAISAPFRFLATMRSDKHMASMGWIEAGECGMSEAFEGLFEMGKLYPARTGLP